MTLREARCKFTHHLARLILWAEGQGYDLALDETKVAHRRKVRKEGETFFAFDAVHMAGSLHYEGLAADLNLYIGEQWIADGSHKAWTEIGEEWERVGKEVDLPLVWGGRFQDANHISFQWQGRK